MKKYTLLFAAILAIFFSSCEDKSQQLESGEGSLTLEFNTPANSSGRLSEISIAAMLLTIEDAEGNVIKEQTKVDIHTFGNSMTSSPIALETGEYNITELMVLDANNATVYATPLEGSELAQLVIDPLPIAFSISKDAVTTLDVEVLSTENQQPEDFGYPSLNLNIVPTFSFQIGAFIYNNTTNSFEMTDAQLTVVANGKTIHQNELSNITNLITTKDNFETYTLYVSKAGYSTFQQTIDLETLKNFYGVNGEPVVAVMEEGLTTTLVLQPHGTDGKDVVIWDYPNGDGDRSTTATLEASAWTSSGISYVINTLIEFDLSTIPANTTISSAALSLYHNPTSHNEGHSQLSGSNEAWLKRVTTTWSESQVGWATQPSTTDVNQVILPASTSNDQDYLDKDVTAMVQDMVNDPANSFGFMMGMVNTTPYRNLVFASSNHEDVAKHPKLVISY